ncbi:MAG: sigma-70 family RNA polymerase sigma factor [Pseudobdellovibrionaceae bacterium]
MKSTPADSNSLDTELQSLVVRSRGGDKPAYEALLKRLTPFFRLNAAKLCRSYGAPDLSEDITQDALLAVHLKLHTYDESLSFLAWARTVLKHKTIDTLRRRKMPTVDIDAFENWEFGEDGAQDAQNAARDLDTLLAQLKPPAGELIYALKVEGASVTELAKAHDLSESNVKVLIHRGLKKLSELVTDEKPVT